MFKLFGGSGDSNEKVIKRLQPIVDKINALEPDFKALNDEDLRAKTDEFKARLKDGATLDELLPEAFAAVREAAWRTLGKRHFDVQLMGGIVLHQGKIAEMKTGEGKTLVATLPLYLNSLTGEGCHLVTVNDYLARRDPYWMGPVFHALGVSVASIYPMQKTDDHTPSLLFDPDYDSGVENDTWRHFKPITRQEAYQADITYGTSSEFGFDYLRDNMAVDTARCVQRPSNYAIVDEVDNLLIDEARTPLIISAPDMEAGQKYQIFSRLIKRLTPEVDYEIKLKERIAELTDEGFSKMENLIAREGLLKDGSGLYDPENADLMRHMRNALNAREFYKRDHQYVVKDGEVIIVDEFTGRMMHGRRYSEGLHQAIEAKEGVKIQQESRTYATITIQNYFRMYNKLAGMTGTAVTEAEEFHKIYNLEVVIIPTNKPLAREDYADQIYKDIEAKFKAVVREVDEVKKSGRPVLIGTVSIEKSEYLGEMLKRKGIKHEVLNAKQHEREANIIAEAGKPGAVTVATNMAGRGVDIILGGKEPDDSDSREWKEWKERHDRVIELGGLHVVGTERHEARRIDNQLRGRAGRQGDPGSSRFFVSLEDDVMKRFGGDRIKGMMENMGFDENTPIENKLISRSIENAQIRVEGYHFDIRKHLVDYDDVINKQREIIYGERLKIIGGADLKANILSLVEAEIKNIVNTHCQGYDMEEAASSVANEVAAIMPLSPEVSAESLSKMSVDEMREQLIDYSKELYEKKEAEIGSESMRILERLLMLRIIDTAWVEHLTAMDNMRQGIGLQAMAQRDPLVAYKRQSREMFDDLMGSIQDSVVRSIFRMSIKKGTPPPKPVNVMAKATGEDKESKTRKAPKVEGKTIGRNDPCPCGSGKKYKKCCGR
ncbi:MAG: preprotein translocase subunit SecA [Dehalococcoidales bacterium]|jgi:preprotein translocase subunit SecA|nr:preprotein translocase subunit SecA [Dehalococcoidales bacterium]